MNKVFWKDKKVIVTGHTGFKGGWLSLWLQHLGAKVIGISLDPPTNPSFYQQANVAAGIVSLREDICNKEAIKKIFQKHQPEIVFHLAAQSLVRYSYNNPVETYETNVMGSMNILEAIRGIDTIQASIFITTDKCYENKEWYWGYREIDPLGGRDPYSSSKGALELLIASYRDSFLINIASARAGNVIGGGDWAEDRLIPDVIRAFQKQETLRIRYPSAIRPWQHVLEPLAGYMQLAEKLFNNHNEYAEAWNFGPNNEDQKTVQWIVENMAEHWGSEVNWDIDQSPHLHEANYLKLDCSKAKAKLNWQPKWELRIALQKTIEWYKAKPITRSYRDICMLQLDEYMRFFD